MAIQWATRKLVIDPMAQLLVFGFDRTTKAGKIFSSCMQELERLLERRVIAKGGAASFDLPKDDIRFRSSSPAKKGSFEGLQS
jgi:hypothetical protein